MKKIVGNMVALAMTAMVWTACEDVPAPYDTPTAPEKEEVTYTGDGSLSNPYTCVDAIKLAESLGGNESDNEVYIKGKVASITEEYSTQFGNGTFTISDDGTTADEFTVYRAYYLGNKKFANGNTPIKVGDDVIVYGKVVNYRGNTPETVQGSAYLYSLNGETESGSSTPDTPTGEVKVVSIAEFNAAAESDDVWYQLTGTVKNLKDGDLYGNFDLEDATGSVYVYGLLSEKGGEKKQFQELVAAKGIKEGSKLTIIGTRGSYKDKIEVMNAYFVSIEEGDTPDTPTTGTGTLENPLTASQAYTLVAAMEKGVTSEEDYYVKGIICSVKYEYSAQYGTATYNISDDGKTGGKEFTAYSSYYFGNQSWKDGDTQIKVGDEVIVCGKVVNYNGNTPEFASKKNWLVSLNGKTE